MKNQIRLLAILAITASTLSNTQVAHGQARTRDGATAGGVAGAIIGGIIGHQNDETPEGALIGGAVGAITGGLIGRAQDDEIQRQRYYQQQQANYRAQQQAHYNAQQQQYAQQQQIVNAGVTVADVTNMSRSGLSDAVIISHLNARGIQRRLEVSEIITLHQQGVSEYVITAMQQARLSSQLTPPQQTVASQPVYQQPVYQPPIQRVPVVVQEPVIYHAPVIVEKIYHRPHPAYHYRRGGASIRIGF